MEDDLRRMLESMVKLRKEFKEDKWKVSRRQVNELWTNLEGIMGEANSFLTDVVGQVDAMDTIAADG